MIPSQNIPPRSYFYLSNGQIIKSMHELPSVLLKIDEKTYCSHVSSCKNDFAKWVYDVFGDVTLSKVIGDIKSKEEMARVAYAYLKQKENIDVIRRTGVSKTSSIQRYDDMIIMRNSSEALQAGPPKADNADMNASANNPQDAVQIGDSIAKPQEAVTNLIEETKKEEPPKIIPEKKEIIHNIENAKEFFEKNPVIMSQIVEAKRDNLKLDPLEIVRQSDDSPEHKVEAFKDKYTKVYERISMMRKNGFITSIAEMMLFRIPPKIKIYEVSKDKKDETIIIRYFNEVIEELNNMKE
jgi:hypothetical protein